MEVSVIVQDYGGQPRMCRCYPTCHRIAEGVTRTHQLSPAFPVDGHNLSRVNGLPVAAVWSCVRAKLLRDALEPTIDSAAAPLSVCVNVTTLDNAAGGA